MCRFVTRCQKTQVFKILLATAHQNDTRKMYLNPTVIQSIEPLRKEGCQNAVRLTGGFREETQKLISTRRTAPYVTDFYTYNFSAAFSSAL